MSKIDTQRPGTVPAGAGQEMARGAAEDEQPQDAPPPGRVRQRPEPSPGIPPWVIVAGFLLLVVAVGGVFGVRWQRDQAARAQETIVAGRATATAEVAARPTVAPSAALAPQPVVGMADRPVFRVESVLAPNLPLALEIRAAETRYWEVYGRALYDLDTSRLPEVAAGPQLQHITSVIENLKQEGHAIQQKLDHLTFIFNADDNKAYLDDKVTNHSQLLEAATKEPIKTDGVDPDIGTKAEYVYTFEKIGGTWKMTNATRVESQ